MSSTSFAGEPYLAIPDFLPDYDVERRWLVVYEILTAIIFFVILPMSLADGPKKQLNTVLLILLNLFGLVAMLWVVLRFSSNNSFTARALWEAPMFTPTECDRIIEMGRATAIANVLQYPDDELLSQQEPKGWRKDRHTSYPTTDLNVVTDPFTKEDRAWLNDKFNARLGPLIHRIYGIHPSAIRANDIFLVRYDGDGDGQNRLRRHTDANHISFNILLNDEFEGGGTAFHNRLDETEIIVAKPLRGQVLINTAVMEHEGLPTTRGTRYILVGFTSIDNVNPWSGQVLSQVSIFATWFSLPWTQVRFKEAHEAILKIQRRDLWYYNNKYVRALFIDLTNLATMIGDWLAPFFHANLIDPTNVTAYLQALDEAYITFQQEQQHGSDDASISTQEASWFKGQQVLVDVDGTVAGSWSTRLANPTKFAEL